MATNNGSSGDDIIVGTSSADHLNGGAGSDTLSGGGGSDFLNGGSGNDILDGGSGSDTLNGDSGNDILIYKLAENAGAGDLYTGGSGIDTVRLMLTNAEWLDDAVQVQLARYFAHLATVQTNNQGEVSNGSSRDFTFNFGSSTTLTVQMMEKLQVYVDGVVVIDLDKPIIDLTDSTVVGSVVEDGSEDGDGNTAETASGLIKFFDLDTTDTHMVSVISPAGAIGSLTAAITNVATGDGQGTVGWTYTLNDAAAQYLSAGETRTEVFIVKITDDDGQCVTQNVTITITGTNDAPTVSAHSDGAVTEDASNPTLTSTVSVNFNDVDLTDLLSYSAVKSSGTLGGTLTPLSSNDSGTGAAGSVSYTYSVANSATQYLAAGQTATETFTITANDGHGGTVSQLVTVTVTGTNDAPTVSAHSDGAVTEDASNPALTSAVSVNFNDVDLTDLLSYSWVKSSGTLGGTLTPLASNDSGTGAAGSVSYTYSVANSATQYLAAGQTATETFTITANDGHGGTVSQLVTVTVTGTNDAPVAVADSNAGLEDTTITGSVASNDSDVDDGAVLSYALVAPVAGLTLNANGSYSFDASNAAYQHLAEGATTAVVANYTVTDEHGASSSSSLTITLTGTNDAPVAVADSNAGLEDTTITGSVASNDSDVDDGAVLSYALDAPVAGLTLNANGSYSFDASNAAYQHLAEGATTAVVANYTVTDEHGASSSSSLTITLTGTNDAPVAVADSNAGLEDTTITGSVASNDSDVDDGAVLSYALDAPVAGLTLNANGSYSFDASNAAYQHLAEGATTAVVANYTVTDEHGASSSSSLTITLTGTNDAPVAVADSNAGLEDTTITGSVASNDSDVDDGAVLSYALDAPVAGLTLNANGSYSFDASNAAYQHLAEGATTAVVANYTVTDEHGASSSSSLTITLTGTNDAPVAVADSNAGLEDTTITGSVASNDSDVDDGAVLSYALVAPVAGLTLNANGSYSFDASNAAYQHLAEGATTAVVANYTVTDEHGASSSSSLTITLTGTNDAPVAVADSNAGLEDTTITGSVASNDSDVDDGAVLSYALDAPVAGLTLNANGSYSFDASNAAYQHLAEGATTAVVANYTVTDEHGASSSSSLTITLTGTNDAPVAVADSNAGLEDTTITGSVASNDSDVDDGAVLSYALDAPVAGLTLNANGSYSFDASNAAYQHLAEGATTAVVANYTVTDEHGASSSSSLTITLTGTNDAPVAVADSNAGLEDTTITGSVASNDSDVDDGAVLSYALDAPVAGLTLNANGSYSFDASNAAYQHLAEGATTAVVANYTVTDEHGASSSSSLTITLTGTNDAPVAVADSNAGLEDTTITGSVASNDSDVDDGAVLSYALDAPVAGLTLNANGSYSFDASNAAYQHLAQGATTAVVANYTVTDEHGASSSSSLTITLTGTNDAPVAVADSNAGLEDTTITGSVASNDSDVDDGAVLSYALVAPVAGLTLNSDGSYSFDASNAAYQHLAEGATTAVVANYTVTDEHGASSSSSLTITLTGTNDAPVAVADSNAGLEDTTITGSVASNDSDVDDGAVLSYALDAPVAGLTLNANGSYSFDASNAAYQHLAEGATTAVVANYTVTDEHGASSSSSLTITLTGTNDAPVAVADSNAGLEDTTITGSVASNDSDVDDGAVLSYALDAPVAGLTLNANGSYSFDASNAAYQHLAEGATTAVVANYTVTDEHGASSSSSLTITLTGTNDAPVAVADSNAGLEDTTITGSVASNDSDVDDGAVLSYALVAPVAGLTLNANGSYSFDASNAAYQHLAEGATTAVVANYTVTDEHGASSSSSLTITLTGTNDAPTISVADSAGAVTEDSATPTLTDSGTITFDDLDLTDAHTTSVTAAGGNTLGGTLTASVTDPATGAGDGTVTWNYSLANSATQSLAAGQTANEQFTVTINDGHGGTVSQLITVTVTGTNDAPVLNAAATPVLGSVAEDAGAPVGAVGTLVSSLVNLNPPAGGLDNVTDADSGAVTGIALTGTNNSDGTWYYSTNNGGSWTAVGSVSNGQALLLASDANSRLYFQANANFNGSVTDAVTFRAWDQTSGSAGTKVDTTGNGGSTAFSSATDTANLTVSPVNDNPVAANDILYVSNSTTVTLSLGTLLGNDTDADGLALSITSFSAAAGQFTASPTLNADGTFSFTTNATGGTVAAPTVRTFTYTVSDGNGGSTTGTVTVNVLNTGTGGGGDTITLPAGGYQGSYIDGKAGSDGLTDGSPPSVLIGGDGADTLAGNGGNDLLIGGDNNDTLTGGAGNDILRGGIGNNDSMDGGTGTEDMLDFSDGTAAVTFTLVQSAAPTSIANGTGNLGNNDTYMNMEGVIGTSLNDTITGSAGNDIIRGGGGNDTLNGGAGTADLWDLSDATAGVALTLVQSAVGTAVNLSAAGLGTDTYSNFEGVIGTNFADTLTGSSSADTIRGGGGTDTINGAGGNDILVGGAGVDILTGGIGSDSFRFLGSDPSAVDTITDFNSAAPGSGGDVLDISDLLVGAPTLNAGDVGQYLDVRESGSNSIVSIDRDGTGSTYGFQDFAVLTGVTGLNLNTLLTNGNID